MTAAEFNELMLELLGVLGAPAATALLKRGERWSLAYDNAGVHAGAAAACRIAHRHPHPPKSPDCQKVVEHVHAYLTQKLQHWLCAQGRSSVQVHAAKAELEAAFSQYPTQGLADDVASLKRTYQAIIAAGGDYPIKRFR